MSEIRINIIDKNRIISGDILEICFENKIADAKVLEEKASDWLKSPQSDLSGRIPLKIIDLERQRINLTATAEEFLVDDDCDICEMMAADFIDTPMFSGFDGSHMEYDRFEFSFHKDRQEWEEEQRSFEEFNREFDEKYKNKEQGDFFEDNEEIF